MRDYQNIAVKKIYDFFKSNGHKAKMYISTGLGKTDIITSALCKILSNQTDVSIAVLTSRRTSCEQIKSIWLETNEKRKDSLKLSNTQNVFIKTYQDFIENLDESIAFDLVICDEAHFVKNEEHFERFFNKQTKFLGLLSNLELPKNWFDDSECLLSYTLKDAVQDGYITYDSGRVFTQRFLIELLHYHGYKNISTKENTSNYNKNDLWADVIAEKDENTAIIDVNFYRSLHNSKTIINNALKQILHYNSKLQQKIHQDTYSFIMVLTCEIDDKVKKEIYDGFNVIIWDIGNLIYLCKDNKELYQLLSSCIPYPISNIEAKRPFNAETNEKQTTLNYIDKEKYSLSEVYINELEYCKTGKENGADKEYELICTKIIKHLFDTEFYRVSEQNRTSDGMFQMDLLCSLKGTTEFWNFLIHFYKTKFVVFEYKNYSEQVSQNSIYITEKYLFSTALRNVAFIVSRKGFDKNAEKAALGCLRENGKLIISLDDKDLVSMLEMKEKGEEPSDYLLEKVEELLMSVSK